MNIDALIVQSVSDVDPKLWEVPGSDLPFLSYQWFAFCERIMPECSPAHILLFRDGRTYARGSFWLMRKDVLPISSQVGRMAGEWLMRRKPLLVCRSPVANVTGLALPTSDREEAFIALAEAAEELGRKSGASFVLYDYFNPREVNLQILPNQYKHMELSEPGTALEIQSKTFEDFLSLLSKQAWKDYRRHSNQAAKLGIRITRHSSVPNVEEAVDLIRRVEKHHGTAPNPWVEAILMNMNMVGGIWLEGRRNEKLVGCGLLLQDGDHLVATLMGLDYDIRYAYFPFIYSAIQTAIEQGIRIFHAGSGAYELKQRLGFVLEENNHIVFGGIGPFLSNVLGFYNTNHDRKNEVKMEEGFQ